MCLLAKNIQEEPQKVPQLVGKFNAATNLLSNFCVVDTNKPKLTNHGTKPPWLCAYRSLPQVLLRRWWQLFRPATRCLRV
jgi:hypothetical protein